MKELNPQEQGNLVCLTDKNIMFCLVQLTETGLKKSLFDATSQVREFIKTECIHDFSKQENGSENKAVIKTHILTFRRDIETETSLYRAVTRGDERMWFGSPIMDVTKPNDVYAIFSKAGEIYLINITTMNIDSAWKSSVPNPIQEFINFKLAHPNSGAVQLSITPIEANNIETQETTVDTTGNASQVTPSGEKPDYERKLAFIKFLRSKDMAVRTIKKYASAIENDEVKAICAKELGLVSLFDTDSTEHVKHVYKIVTKSQFNRNGHNMYSVAIHHYCKFLETLQQPVDLFPPEIPDKEGAKLIEPLGNAQYISTGEAAEIAGVTTETIRYLCKEGAVRYQIRSHMYFPCREDVANYAKSISQIHAIKKDIEKIEYELKGQREALLLQFKKNKKYLAEANMSPQRIVRIAELVYALLQQYEKKYISDFSERDIELLLMMYRGVTFPEAGVRMKLTGTRARQIWGHILRKIAEGKSILEIKNKEIEDLNNFIRQQKEEFTASIVDPVRKDMIENIDLLLTPLESCHFSSRVNRAFEYARIYTVYDLVKYKRKDLLGLPYIGKKSLVEVDDWLESKGLFYGIIFPPHIEEMIRQRKILNGYKSINV